MTEYNNQYYIFPIFNTIESKFWLNEEEIRNNNQRNAKDYLAEKVLQNL